MVRQLEQAKSCFYSWRLVEAYHILRRFYDRLPFKPEKEHAEYIGIFVRTLMELGKEYELKFYVERLETLYKKFKIPSIGYPLAVVYLSGGKERIETAKQILEDIIKNPAGRDYQAKAKMMLADYYDQHLKDTAACRFFIDSIEEPSDPHLKPLVAIWKAKNLRDEGRYDESEAALIQVLTKLTPETDWYAYFSAKTVLALLYLKREREEEARAIVSEVRQIFENRHFKTVQAQLDTLETFLETKNRLSSVQLIHREDGSVLVYDNRTLSLKEVSPADRILLLFTKKKYLDKDHIIKALYARAYLAPQDDKLIYSHMHVLRKRLKSIGLPAESIQTDKKGYHLIPKIEIVEEEL